MKFLRRSSIKFLTHGKMFQQRNIQIVYIVKTLRIIAFRERKLSKLVLIRGNRLDVMKNWNSGQVG